MLRVIGFSLLMLFAVAVTLPVAESYAGRGKSGMSWQKRSKRMTRRQRQAYLRRRRAALRRKRMLARLRAQEAQKTLDNTNLAKAQFVPASTAVVLAGAPRLATPAGWSGGVSGSEMRWQVPLAAGSANVTFTSLGSADSSADAASNRRNRTLGGFAQAGLRRQVIDRMIAEGGWVTNDAERVIGGHPTFVVHAASGSQAAPRLWTFYFTVVGDRLYRFTSDAPGDGTEKLTGEIESLVASLRAPVANPLTARGDSQ